LINIEFYSRSKKPKVVQALQEYREIWEKEGKKIVNVIEKISGLKFSETDRALRAEIIEGESRSEPFQLNANWPKEIKKGVIVHELCHRLLHGNGIDYDVIKKIIEFDKTLKARERLKLMFSTFILKIREIKDIGRKIKKGSPLYKILSNYLEGIKIGIIEERFEVTLKVHKALDLILYDIWADLYGENFAQSMVAIESNFSDLSYKKAWQWALSLSREGRAEKFKELKKIQFFFI
jgi:hypothetical protein